MATEPFAFALFLHNRPGVLNRVALVFSRRGWNIENVSISKFEDPAFSRCTLIATGPRDGLNNVAAQLNKLIDVVSARHVTVDERVISSEVLLVKVRIHVPKETLAAAAQELGGLLVDDGGESAIFQFVGTNVDNSEIRDRVAERFEVMDVVRSGLVTMHREEHEQDDVATMGPEILLTALGDTVIAD